MAEIEVGRLAAANDETARCPGGDQVWCVGASVSGHRSGGAAFMEDGSEAPRRGGVTARRQGARSSGGAKRSAAKPVRVQLHLGAITAQRLGVHAAMSQQD